MIIRAKLNHSINKTRLALLLQTALPMQRVAPKRLYKGRVFVARFANSILHLRFLHHSRLFSVRPYRACFQFGRQDKDGLDYSILDYHNDAAPKAPQESCQNATPKILDERGYSCVGLYVKQLVRSHLCLCQRPTSNNPAFSLSLPKIEPKFLLLDSSFFVPITRFARRAFARLRCFSWKPFIAALEAFAD